MRITYKETTESFSPIPLVSIFYGIFYKDGVEFVRIKDSFVYGFKMYYKNDDDMKTEMKRVLFHALNDPSLEDEFWKVFEERFLKTRL
jgi:hypothetical protein